MICETRTEGLRADDRPIGPSQAATVDSTLNAEIRRICVTEGGYPDQWLRHHFCPCCGVGKLASLFSKYQFNHDQCDRCGFVCVNPFPPEEVIKNLYDGSYYSNFREYYEAGEARAGRQQSISAAPLPLVEQIIAQATAGRGTGDWLDVGGGLGTVAELVRRRRPEWRVALNEFNSRSVALAREIYGLDVLSSNAFELRRSSRRFDVISMIQVLEHIIDPLSFLRSYTDLLKPDGIILIVVPQFTRLNAAVSKAASPTVTPPFHVSLFREENLLTLLDRVGTFEGFVVRQFGPPAFNLLHHYDVSDYWDISIPTSDHPTPKGVLIKEYPLEISTGLNALAEADRALGKHFSKVDGSLYLIGLACKQEVRWQEILSTISTPGAHEDSGNACTDEGSISLAIKTVEYAPVSPGHPATFVYRELLREHENCAAEIARLNSMIVEQTAVHDSITRINVALQDRIDTYSAEIKELNETISEIQQLSAREIERLNEIIADCQRSYATEIQQLKDDLSGHQQGYTSEIVRLNEIIIDRQRSYTVEIERLNEIIIDHQNIHTVEIERLNQLIYDRQRSYTAEIERLNEIIANHQNSYTVEIERLNEIIQRMTHFLPIRLALGFARILKSLSSRLSGY